MGMQNHFWGRGINVWLRGEEGGHCTGTFISCHTTLHGCGGAKWMTKKIYERAPGIPAPQSGVTGTTESGLGKPKTLDSRKIGAKGAFPITCSSFYKMLARSHSLRYGSDRLESHILSLSLGQLPHPWLAWTQNNRGQCCTLFLGRSQSPRAIAHVGLVGKGSASPQEEESGQEVLVAFSQSHIISWSGFGSIDVPQARADSRHEK